MTIRTWYSMGDVCRAQEEHLGQVDRHIHVMIHESGVLLRVQHLEERRCGVSLPPATHLVDLRGCWHVIALMRA